MVEQESVLETIRPPKLWQTTMHLFNSLLSEAYRDQVRNQLLHALIYRGEVGLNGLLHSSDINQNNTNIAKEVILSLLSRPDKDITHLSLSIRGTSTHADQYLVQRILAYRDHNESSICVDQQMLTECIVYGLHGESIKPITSEETLFVLQYVQNLEIVLTNTNFHRDTNDERFEVYMLISQTCSALSDRLEQSIDQEQNLLDVFYPIEDALTQLIGFIKHRLSKNTEPITDYNQDINSLDQARNVQQLLRSTRNSMMRCYELYLPAEFRLPAHYFQSHSCTTVDSSQAIELCKIIIEFIQSQAIKILYPRLHNPTLVMELEASFDEVSTQFNRENLIVTFRNAIEKIICKAKAEDISGPTLAELLQLDEVIKIHDEIRKGFQQKSKWIYKDANGQETILNKKEARFLHQICFQVESMLNGYPASITVESQDIHKYPYVKQILHQMGMFCKESKRSYVMFVGSQFYTQDILWSWGFTEQHLGRTVVLEQQIKQLEQFTDQQVIDAAIIDSQIPAQNVLLDTRFQAVGSKVLPLIFNDTSITFNLRPGSRASSIYAWDESKAQGIESSLLDQHPLGHDYSKSLKVVHLIYSQINPINDAKHALRSDANTSFMD